jgi:hypothetical protein
LDCAGAGIGLPDNKTAFCSRLAQAERAIINPVKNNIAERFMGSSGTELKLKVTELIQA